MKFQQPFITLFEMYFIFVEIETFKLEAHKRNVPKYLFNEFRAGFYQVLPHNMVSSRIADKDL